ncbi:MAG: hypothetical protein DRP47_12875, partial [Candidatus Zixiibacteriota bacterium]
ISELDGCMGCRDQAKRVSCFRIFFSFLRRGLTACGGPAMVAYIRDLSSKDMVGYRTMPSSRCACMWTSYGQLCLGQSSPHLSCKREDHDAERYQMIADALLVIVPFGFIGC